MTIAFRGIGAFAVNSAGDTTPAIPAATTTGDMMLLFATYRGSTGWTGSPTGWTFLGRILVTVGGEAADSGSAYTHCWYREWQSGDTAPTVLRNAENTHMSVIISYSKTAATWETPVFATGTDSTPNTSHSAAASSDPGGTSGDMLVVSGGTNGNLGLTRSALTGSWAGITGVTNQRGFDASSSGRDLSLAVDEFSVSSGTSTGNPNLTWTWGEAAGANSPATSSIYVRLRESSGATAVGKDLQFIWNTSAVVGKSLQSIWNVRAFVGKSLDIRWNALTTVGKDLQTIWNIRASAGKSLALQWNVAASVGKSLDARWNVNSTVGKNLELIWNTLDVILVGKNLQFVWNVRANAGKSLQTIWNVNTFVGKNLDIRWNALATVGKNLQTIWNVRAVAGKSLDVRWNVASPVGKNLQTIWNVRSFVGKSLDLRWNISATVGKNVQFLWNIRSFVGKDIQFLWNVLAAAVAITVRGSLADTTNATSYVSPAYTPANDELIVVVVYASGVADPTSLSCSASANGITTFTRVQECNGDAGGASLAIFVSDAKTTGTASMTHTITTNASTGMKQIIYGIAGMSKFGALAVRQTAEQENATLGFTPEATFASTTLTGNPTIGVVGNNSNPAGITEPSGWTEAADIGHATPVAGIESVYRDSGFVGTTITWGGTSATRGAAAIVELDASSGAPVGKSLQAIWNVNALVGKNLQLVWRDLVPVGKDIQFLWNVLFTFNWTDTIYGATGWTPASPAGSVWTDTIWDSDIWTLTNYPPTSWS